MAGNHRFFVKLVSTYVVYDRQTGLMIGSTITDAEVSKRILVPRGYGIETKIDEGAPVKIPFGAEDEFHTAFRKIVFATADDKAFEASRAPVAKL